MNLNDVRQSLMRMQNLSGKQSREYRCNQKTLDELLAMLQAPKNFAGIVNFAGVRLTVDDWIPDGKFFPAEYLESVERDLLK